MMEALFPIDLQIFQLDKVSMHAIWDRIVSENGKIGKKDFDVVVECTKDSDENRM